MATRRSVLGLAAAVPAAVLLGACRPASAPSTTAPSGPAGPADALVVRTRAGLALLNAGERRFVAGPWSGAAAWDASAFATTRAAAGQTALEVLNHRGQRHYAVDLTGGLIPRVVSPQGGLVALVPAGLPGDAYRPGGRHSTTIVVAGWGGERARLTVPGCVEPEAFSAAGDHLFVLDYLPPARPDRYRVRMLELASGRLRPLFTRDKTVIPPGAEEEMRGQGRQAVYASQRGFLFTLYTHSGDHRHTRDLLAGRADGARDNAPHVHAFVHTLSLDQSFAYCVDLPAPFGEGPAHAHAIALRPGFEDPYVVDTTSATLAHVDPGSLQLDRITRVAGIAAAGAGAATALGAASSSEATVSPDGTALYVGAGTAVHVVRTADLTLTGTWRVPAAVHGLGVSPDGRRVWAGQPGGAIALDARSGRTVATVTAAEMIGLDRVADPS